MFWFFIWFLIIFHIRNTKRISYGWVFDNLNLFNDFKVILGVLGGLGTIFEGFWDGLGRGFDGLLTVVGQ